MPIPFPPPRAACHPLPRSFRPRPGHPLLPYHLLPLRHAPSPCRLLLLTPPLPQRAVCHLLALRYPPSPCRCPLPAPPPRHRHRHPPTLPPARAHAVCIRSCRAIHSRLAVSPRLAVRRAISPRLGVASSFAVELAPLSNLCIDYVCMLPYVRSLPTASTRPRYPPVSARSLSGRCCGPRFAQLGVRGPHPHPQRPARIFRIGGLRVSWSCLRRRLEKISFQCLPIVCSLVSTGRTLVT